MDRLPWYLVVAQVKGAPRTKVEALGSVVDWSRSCLNYTPLRSIVKIVFLIFSWVYINKIKK